LQSYCFLYKDFDDAAPAAIACDLPVRYEIIYGLSEEKRRAHHKNARPKFPLSMLVIKHREHLKIVILVAKIVSYHDENINIVWF
jgi:hypothetical protein